jgi:hypothetical protein
VAGQTADTGATRRQLGGEAERRKSRHTALTGTGSIGHEEVLECVLRHEHQDVRYGPHFFDEKRSSPTVRVRSNADGKTCTNATAQTRRWDLSHSDRKEVSSSTMREVFSTL